MSIKNIIGAGLIVSIITTSLSCTKLDPVPYSVVTSEVFWSDPAQAANAVAPVYSALNGFANGENMRLANATERRIVDPRNLWRGAYLEGCGSIPGAPETVAKPNVEYLLQRSDKCKFYHVSNERT
jgi:hypothetical protein